MQHASDSDRLIGGTQRCLHPHQALDQRPSLASAHAAKQHDPEPDHVLVREAQAGSPEAFEQLVERYYPLVLRYLTRQTGDPTLAADLTQETFLDAWRDLNRLADGHALTRWLYRIARNNLLPQWRQRHVESVDRLMAEEGGTSPALQQTDLDRVSDEHDVIQRALDKLSPLSQQALLLHSALGFTSEEVAEILGISHEAARKRIGRAKQQFRKEYDASH